MRELENHIKLLVWLNLGVPDLTPLFGLPPHTDSGTVLHMETKLETYLDTYIYMSPSRTQMYIYIYMSVTIFHPSYGT